MPTLIWSFNPATGEMERVPDGVARSRGIHRDLDYRDHTCEVEFRPGAADAPYVWRAPEYPKREG